MDNQEMRRIKEQLEIVDWKIAFKTGVRYDTIVDFFKGKTDELDPVCRRKIEEMLIKEQKNK
ncbi:MAG: hypothetical protein KBS68_01740 [Clostridiales bacterium]|nr:hypothetical protein [Candidatus Crickella merdequi]